jgi:hypothetical protein
MVLAIILIINENYFINFMIISLLLLPLIGVLMLLPLGKERNFQILNITQYFTLTYIYLIIFLLETISNIFFKGNIDSRLKNFYERTINSQQNKKQNLSGFSMKSDKELMKQIALLISLLNLVISIYMWFQFDYNSTSYQFVYEFNNLNFCHFHVGVDGISLYFVLLTTFITPICILSN